MERGGNLKTYDRHLVPDDFDLWSPEVLEGDDARETGAVDHVPGVGEDVDCEPDVPYLPGACVSDPASLVRATGERHACRDDTHPLASKHTETLLVHRVASPEDLVEHARKRDLLVRRPAQTRFRRLGEVRRTERQADTHLPARLVLVGRHGRELRVDRDHALERPLRRRLHHLPVHLREHPMAASNTQVNTQTVDNIEEGPVRTSSCPWHTQPSRAPDRKSRSEYASRAWPVRRDEEIVSVPHRQIPSLELKAMAV